MSAHIYADDVQGVPAGEGATASDFGITVGIEESASYVEDMWPDEVEFILAGERARITAEVLGLSFDGLDEQFCWEEEIRAAVLAAVDPK